MSFAGVPVIRYDLRITTWIFLAENQKKNNNDNIQSGRANNISLIAYKKRVMHMMICIDNVVSVPGHHFGEALTQF